jgi:hypothetical protein
VALDSTPIFGRVALDDLLQLDHDGFHHRRPTFQLGIYQGLHKGMPRLIGPQTSNRLSVRSLQDRPVPNRYRLDPFRNATWAPSLSA